MTTTRLRLTRRDRARAWLSQRDPIALASVIVLLLIIAISAARPYLGPAALVAAVPTPPLPIIMIATAPAVPPPPPAALVAAVLPANVTKRAIVVYADHDLATAIGAVEAGRPYRLLARFGADWLQADVTGSGVVWLRSADVLDLPADLVDLQPAPAPQVIYQVVNQPMLAVEQVPAPAVATPEQYHQVLTERQRNIQQHYVQPVYPTLAPLEQNDVTQEWARQQYLAEHPEAGR